MNIQCFFSISKHITLIGKPFITNIYSHDDKIQKFELEIHTKKGRICFVNLGYVQMTDADYINTYWLNI